MDIKDIIKWFIPCFLNIFIKLLVLSLFVSIPMGKCAIFNNVNNTLINNRTEVLSINNIGDSNTNLSKSIDFVSELFKEDEFTARTWGRPMKKMAAALIPLAFQIGAASSWAVVSAILSFKAVAIGLLLLMMKIAAGAAKFGSLFDKHPHPQPQTWHPQPGKEVHLHIHNAIPEHHQTHGEHHTEYSADPWSRTGGHYDVTSVLGGQQLGPYTINTPYGSYVRIGPPSQSNTANI